MVRFTDHVADREAAVEQAVKVERERRLAELAAKQTLNDELNNLTDRIEKMADQWEKQIEVLLRPLVPASETNRKRGFSMSTSSDPIQRLVVDYEGEEGNAYLTLSTYSPAPTGLLPLDVGEELVTYTDHVADREAAVVQAVKVERARLRKQVADLREVHNIYSVEPAAAYCRALKDALAMINQEGGTDSE